MNIILTCPYQKDTTFPFSVEELKERYLFGLPLERDGKAIPYDVFQHHLLVAYNQVEDLLNLKLKRTKITENKDFNYDDWTHWSYVKSTYPVVCPIALDGYLGTIKQVHYPRQWITGKKTNDGKLYSRILYMVPTYPAAMGNQNSVVVSGIIPSLNWFSSYMHGGHIPCYWTLEYITGWSKIPVEIIDAIYKLASIQLLMIVSDMLMGSVNPAYVGSGVGWGISSKSISIDGLSQSLSSTAPQNGIFAARLKQYLQDLGDIHGKNSGQLQQLVDFYKDINWIVA